MLSQSGFTRHCGVHGGERDPDRVLVLYGRGDDDGGQKDAAVVIGLAGTGVSTTTFCTECLGRAKPCLPLLEARGARIGWYLSRRAARVQKAKATVKVEVQAQTGTGRSACA